MRSCALEWGRKRRICMWVGKEFTMAYFKASIWKNEENHSLSILYSTVSPFFTNSQIIFSWNSNWAPPEYLEFSRSRKGFPNYVMFQTRRKACGNNNTCKQEVLGRTRSRSRSLLPASSRHAHTWHRAPLGPMAIYLFNVKTFVLF
jgi:hypothetical protein